MDKEINSNKINNNFSTGAYGMETLASLALDMRWSWNHAADELWQQLAPDMWQQTRNPWVMLQSVSRTQLEERLSDEGFRSKMNELVQSKQASAGNNWFKQSHEAAGLNCVAYFSMEFMLSECLPIYVGGLGNVAGDQLKAASDLGVPVVGIGLLYQQGYFRQEIDSDGNQQALFPYNDPGQMPITPLRLPNGEWLRIKIELSAYTLYLRAWQVQVGGVRLFLLDSNDAANLPAHRSITGELYGGGDSQRIQQEIILGMGGLKLLRSIGIMPEVCHMNEGHAAFLVLERANQFMKDNGVSFDAALAVTRAGNLFTTHTAVAAGFDHFSPLLMCQFFGSYAKNELGIEFNQLMALGRQDAHNTSESFNMAYLAIRGSGAVNGVSKLHGVVSRHLFQTIFPRWPQAEVPVGYVTNGVHMPSWDAAAADEAWTNACGKHRWRGEQETLEDDISALTDDAIWQMRNTCRAELVNYTRNRFATQLSIAGEPPEIVEIAKNVFNPNALTLGFARRFVPYKRPNLLLHDEERLIRILTNKQCPVQLIIAGKAPPFDEGGKALVRQWVQFIKKHSLYSHVVFLSDYDMLLAEHLVQGADVWVNTPRRPWEACGTSGMKVLVNGGLNLSELDGWWAEAYTPEVGWALGDEQEHGDDPFWDSAEAEALYSLLEKQVIPEFYQRNQSGIPIRWTERVRKSMATLTPQFSANRAVREYTEHYYLPAAQNYLTRAADKGAVGARINEAHKQISDNWQKITFGQPQSEVFEDGFGFQIHVFLEGINLSSVLVELYAEGIKGNPPERIGLSVTAVDNGRAEYICQAKVVTVRPAAHYTARVIAAYEDICVPLEDHLILWAK